MHVVFRLVDELDNAQDVSVQLTMPFFLKPHFVIPRTHLFCCSPLIPGSCVVGPGHSFLYIQYLSGSPSQPIYTLGAFLHSNGSNSLLL